MRVRAEKVNLRACENDASPTLPEQASHVAVDDRATEPLVQPIAPVSLLTRHPKLCGMMQRIKKAHEHADVLQPL
eukprot:6161912-Prymnesium_polylepis.1